MNRIELVTRRSFLGNVFTAGAFVLGARLLPADALAAAPATLTGAEQAAWNPNVYLGIETNGQIIIVTHRSEMGTGIRSVLPVVMAEELDADWSRVKLEQAIGATKYGSQNTDGSCSIRDFYDSFREAGATARMMLESAAAAKWGVPVSEVKARKHQVVHTKSKKALGFGELATLAAQQAVPKKADLQYKSPAEYRYVGKSMPTIDVADISAGKGTFGMDATMPGMVYASIERSPVFGGKLKSVDDQDAKKVRGVQHVVTIPAYKPPHLFQALGGVAVIADNTWSALKGRESLKVEWESGDNAAFDSAKYKATLLETVRKPQKSVRNVGDVDAEFAKGGKTHEAEYYVPLLSHAPMEPPVAVADYRDGKVVIKTCTQNPQAVQDTVAAALGIKKENVECHVTLLGGGFGRKSKPDYVAEAALLSKSVGKPVKVVWSREDDIRFDYYHAVAAMYMKAKVNDRGNPVAWLQRSAFPSIGSTFAGPMAVYGQGFEMGMGWTDVPFEIPNHRAENGPAKPHVRIGWLRSVANIYHAFAVHSFADELAKLAGRDSVEYLLDILGQPRRIDLGDKSPLAVKFPIDTGRMRRVIEIAAEKSGWAKKKSGNGRGVGIAMHRSFYSYIAAVVEVEVEGGKVRIPRVDYVVDAGKIINPDRVKSQFEGASVFGTSIAMMSQITAKGGEIEQSNFHDYLVARMPEAPRETHVHIVDSNEAPAGVGEPGVPPLPPAICNAIAAATGKRIRELPIGKQLA
ncbi:MAG: molybdopterin cofactor-binding domain-containing protein [Blastocatellia bacterium]